MEVEESLDAGAFPSNVFVLGETDLRKEQEILGQGNNYFLHDLRTTTRTGLELGIKSSELEINAKIHSPSPLP